MPKCDDCESLVSLTLAPYGASFMVEIDCPNCGVSYDTDIAEEDIQELCRAGL